MGRGSALGFDRGSTGKAKCGRSVAVGQTVMFGQWLKSVEAMGGGGRRI